MSHLTYKDLDGVQMRDINNYIDTINEYLGQNIRKGKNWRDAAKQLLIYLDEHNFVQHEGSEINDDTIDRFISRILEENKTINLNFLPDNKLIKPMSVKPVLHDDPVLNEYRDVYFRGLQDAKYPKRDLGKDLDVMHKYTEFFNERGSPFPKKEKKQKIGKLGMNELQNIVLTMNQDIKQIKDAQSLAGARAWVQKHGPELYHVEDVDVNGDNIPDIIVRNKDNVPVIVNGYTTSESTYPYRYSYYTEFPTAKERKEAREAGNTFREYVKGMYNPQYDEYRMKIQRDKQGNPVFANQQGLEFETKIKNSGYTKIMRPKDKTPYQAFVSGIVKPIYDALKLINRLLGKPTQSTLLTKIAAVMWNETILIPAMVYVYGNDVGNVSDAEYKKLRNKAEVKNAILNYVRWYLSKPARSIHFVPLFIRVCNEGKINPIPIESVPYLERIVKAGYLNISVSRLPQISDTQGWAAIDTQFEEEFGTWQNPK